MAISPLEQVELRLNRASAHLHAVISATEFLWGACNKGVRREVQDSGAAHVYHTAIPDHATERINPAAADCIHNIRACLDNLVYRLAELNLRRVGKLPPSDDHTTCFPICRTKSEYDSKRRSALTHTSKEAKTFVKKLQPYKHWKPPEASPLWILSELDNIDKHRFPLGLAVDTSISLTHSTPLGYSVTPEWHQMWTALATRNGARLVTFHVEPPNEDLDVEFDPHFLVVFDERSSAAVGRAASATLSELISEVRTILHEAAGLPEVKATSSPSQ